MSEKSHNFSGDGDVSESWEIFGGTNVDMNYENVNFPRDDAVPNTSDAVPESCHSESCTLADGDRGVQQMLDDTIQSIRTVAEYSGGLASGSDNSVNTEVANLGITNEIPTDVAQMGNMGIENEISTDLTENSDGAKKILVDPAENSVDTNEILGDVQSSETISMETFNQEILNTIKQKDERIMELESSNKELQKKFNALEEDFNKLKCFQNTKDKKLRDFMCQWLSQQAPMVESDERPDQPASAVANSIENSLVSVTAPNKETQPISMDFIDDQFFVRTSEGLIPLVLKNQEIQVVGSKERPDERASAATVANISEDSPVQFDHTSLPGPILVLQILQENIESQIGSHASSSMEQCQIQVPGQNMSTVTTDKAHENSSQSSENGCYYLTQVSNSDLNLDPKALEEREEIAGTSSAAAKLSKRKASPCSCDVTCNSKKVKQDEEFGIESTNWLPLISTVFLGYMLVRRAWKRRRGDDKLPNEVTLLKKIVETGPRKIPEGIRDAFNYRVKKYVLKENKADITRKLTRKSVKASDEHLLKILEDGDQNTICPKPECSRWRDSWKDILDHLESSNCWSVPFETREDLSGGGEEV